MFVNEPGNRRTIDHERNMELRFIDSGPERPNTFSLTVDGTPIAFRATVRTVAATDGSQALAWTVLAVGIGHLSFSGAVRHSIPGYHFANASEREKICSLIDEALRVYRDLHGMIATPVAEISFLPSELRG